MSRYGIVLGLVLGSAFYLGGCGASSNVNQIFKTSGEDGRVDSLMALGRIHYDNGEYDDALKYSQKAYDINQDNEKAAILLSYVLLGQIGIDPFTMTKNLSESTASKTETKLAEDTSTNAFGSISGLFGISTEDTLNMGAFDDDTKEDLAVFLPIKADEAREKVASLINITAAIKAICPFVSDAARIPDYAPHVCEAAEGEIKFQAKSNFLWALAHIGEALAFNSVLLYPGEPGDKVELNLTQATALNTGLFRKVNSLNGKSFALEDISSYVSAVQELRDQISLVFDTTDGGMLHGTLADLTAVVAGFGAIAGIPSSVTDKIGKVLTDIQKITETLGEKAGIGGDAEALKIKMNSTISGKLKTSIAKFDAEYSDEKLDSLNAADKAKVVENRGNLCTAYQDISGYNSYSDETKAEKESELPDGCQN